MYIVIDKISKYGYCCTDLGGISDKLGISKFTIKHWFEKGKEYHETHAHIIVKGELVKSKRHGNGLLHRRQIDQV